MVRIGGVRKAVAAATLLTASLAVVLTGCSGPTTGPDPAATAGGRPLDAYLNPPVDEQAAAAKQQQIEELVATCMKDHGFTYTPTASVAKAKAPQEANLSDRGWVEKYGYGISTRDELPDEEQTDPNAERMEQMTKSQREAYLKALHGSGGMASTGGGKVATRRDGEAPAEGEDQGCFGEAHQQVYPDRKPVDFEEFEDLFDAIAELDQKVQADSRIAPLIEAWAGCMAGAGHGEFSTINAPEKSIQRKWADLNGWQIIEEGEGGGKGTSITRRAGEDPEPPDPEKVAELRAEELELALADVDCRGDYTAIVEQVRNELEQQFIADHRQQLERYRDLLNQGR